MANDGGPAFPTSIPFVHDRPCYEESGMSLRDWFATFAKEPEDNDIFQAIVVLDHQQHEKGLPDLPRTHIGIKAAAYLRYIYADAMLAEREK